MLNVYFKGTNFYIVFFSQSKKQENSIKQIAKSFKNTDKLRTKDKPSVFTADHFFMQCDICQ